MTPETINGLIAFHDLQHMLPDVKAWRTDLYLLKIPVIDSLATNLLGLGKIDICHKFGHASLVALDGLGQAMFALHTFGVDKKHPGEPLEVGTKKSHLRSFVVTPEWHYDRARMHGHLHLQGAAQPSSATVSPQQQFEDLKIYDTALAERQFAYAVPADVVQKQMADIGKKSGITADGKSTQHLVLQSLLKLDPDVFGEIARRVTKYPVAGNGFNSNSGYHDHAQYLGLQRPAELTHDKVPFIDRSMKDALDGELERAQKFVGHDDASALPPPHNLAQKLAQRFLASRKKSDQQPANDRLRAERPVEKVEGAVVEELALH